jgi:tetratricopeptide (TPR) repeat protein
LNLARALPAAAVCLAAACGDGGAWRAQLVPVPEPDLARHEESARKKVQEVRARLEKETASRRATPATAAAAFGELGRVYFAHDLWSSAEASLANAAALAPDDRRWPYLLGAIAQAEGRLDEAAPRLERALELAPGDGATLIRLGQVDFDRNLRASSRRRYEQALANPAFAPAAHFGLGRIAAAEGDLAGAVVHYEQVLAAQPRAMIVHHGLGLVLRRLGRRQDAQRHLAQAGSAAIVFPDPVLDELADLMTGARAYLRRGARAQQDGDLEQAQRHYRAAVEADPGLAVAQFSLGTLLVERGDFAQAIVHLQRGTEIDPGSATAFESLATALFRQGRVDESLAALDRALTLDPAHHSARLRRAAMRRDRGEVDLARADLEEILAREPLHAEAIASLAVLLARAGQGQKADRLLRDAVARRPPDAETHAHFARAHLALAREWMRAGEWAQARAALERGRQQLPGDLILSSALAEVLAGSPDPAVRNGRRALQLATTAYEANHAPEHGEAVGMALAELGRFDEAVRFQRELVAKAETAGAPAEVRARLGKNLGRYERREAVRIGR